MPITEYVKIVSMPKTSATQLQEQQRSRGCWSARLTTDPPENCHLTVKNLPFFTKKNGKNILFFFQKNENFLAIVFEKCQVFSIFFLHSNDNFRRIRYRTYTGMLDTSFSTEQGYHITQSDGSNRNSIFNQVPNVHAFVCKNCL